MSSVKNFSHCTNSGWRKTDLNIFLPAGHRSPVADLHTFLELWVERIFLWVTTAKSSSIRPLIQVA